MKDIWKEYEPNLGFKRTKSNRRHLLANKTKRQKKSGKVQNAYASKTCENTIKKLLPYGG